MPRKSWVILAGLALFLLGALFIWATAKSAQAPFLTARAPAYDTLVHAATLLQVTTPTPADHQLVAYVAANAPALEVLRKALQQPFEAPPAAYDTAAAGSTLNQIASMKSLALALKNEGLNAQRQGDIPSAARSYIDILRLGQKIEAGPLIFMLIGVSLERIGLEALEKIEPELTPPARSEVAAALKQINTQRIPFSSIEDRERYIRRRNSPTPLHYLIFSRHLRAAMDKGQQKYEQTVQAVDALASKLQRPPAGKN